MFGWLRNAPTAPPPEIIQQGFFSTDVDLRSNMRGDLRKKLTVALAKSIQKTAADFVVMPEGVAMDEATNGLQLAKLQNNSLDVLPFSQLGFFASQGFIGYQACALISQQWLVYKACSVAAKDAVRHGYEITVNDGSTVSPEVLDYLRQCDKRYRIKRNCVEFVRMGRIFGVRIAMFMVESSDPDYYQNPFNPDGITPGSYKGIVQIDPYWVTPELSQEAASNPAAVDFYDPTWWRVNGKRIHRSHLVIFRNGEVPDILKPTYLYGGIPVPQKIAERVFAAERTANEAPMLAMSKRLTVLNADVAQALANPGAFAEKMAVWMEFLNNFGVKIIGGDEKIEQYDTSLADLDETIMTQFQLVAAAADVPVTKLLGTTPKGFNATGEYDESSYHEELESIQEHDLADLVNRHHVCVIRSEVAPKFKMKPFGTDATWKPVDSPNAKELAELNDKKADTDGKLVTSGAINGEDVRNRLISDPDSGYNGIPAMSQEELAPEPEEIDEGDGE